jgi:hypothetical protein
VIALGRPREKLEIANAQQRFMKYHISLAPQGQSGAKALLPRRDLAFHVGACREKHRVIMLLA